MAGFLRKKKQDPAPTPSPSRPPSSQANNAQQAASPIFARFATAAVEPSAQRVVSSPMLLASDPRRDQAPRMANGGAVRGAFQQREDAKQLRQTSGPSYVQQNPPPSSSSAAASASIAYASSYGSPMQNQAASPRSRSQTLPPAPPPSNPPNRRFSHVPGADKPLPSIHPQDGSSSDPLGSLPPQSSLPANRRASTRGPSGATQNHPNGRVMAVPVQQPHISSPTRPPSNASPRLGARPFASSSQTPSAAPNPTPGSSQDPSRYPKEHTRQDLRHKLSNASTASGRQPAIPAPASPPRNGQWAPDGRAPLAASVSSYEDSDASFTPANPKSRAAVINPAPTPPSPPPEPETDMGATISSFEVQSFHPDNSFKINTGLLPAQHITPANHNAKPKRTPSSLVKGRPLIFAAMATVDASPSEKTDYNPYGNSHNAYPSPPTDAVKMPPRLLSEETDGLFDLGFSRTVMDSWDQQQQQQPPHERQTPKINGNTPLPNVRGGQTPRLNGSAPLPPQSPPPLQVATQQQQPQAPQRVPTKSRNPVASPTPLSPKLNPVASPTPMSPKMRPTPIPDPPPTPHTPRTLTKSRPTTPQRKMSSAALQQPSPLMLTRDLDERTASRASTLMLDDDPFAKVEGVRMLKPTSRDGPPPTPPPPPSSTGSASEGSVPESPSTPRQEAGFDAADAQNAVNITPPQKIQGGGSSSKAPPSPVTPEEYRTARSRRRGDQLEKTPPAGVKGIEVRETRIPGPFPLAEYVANPPLLSALLVYLSFYDWCILSAVTKEMRMCLVGTPELREAALERYLRTVGYSRWAWEDADPLELTLLDLHDYMRGVSIPTHEYSRVAETYVQSFNVPSAERDPEHLAAARNLTMSTRAYTRVVLRLRAQAEREASDAAALKAASPPPAGRKRIISNGYASNRSSPSRTSSRAPSPNFGHTQQPSHSSAPGTAFRSPLFRVKRAPLLRVFVPSPDGDWLSDKSVLECEAELKRAGVLGLLRVGDVVWDIAVGDEGNVGRLVWDGSYLIDLDYKYSTVGDLPHYLPTLAFPPSYFHRVIRTGPASSNPIVHVDISPWGQEIAANLQLLQDRIRTETPQGNVHNVVRWVHRSSFVIRAPSKQRMSTSGRRPPSPRIPIPESAGLFVDPGWYGTIVVETEGTNEALADIQDRCPGAFPPRAGGAPTVPLKDGKDSKKVFKILREKSRPGEIWIRTVGPKERLF
ncbi:hypothetical protein B0H19DRAFT_1157416 [Mycena capillaripes]|nr:hypothetical protein B0H19DRAFT_1157416 [Mycena capillaripes]